MRFEKKEDCYLDTKTGLEWSLDNYESMSWQEAVDFCQKLGSGWKLPKIEELISIVEYTKSNPATELSEMLSSGYWSKSSLLNDPTNAWGIGFKSGSVIYNRKTYHGYIRCVRKGHHEI